MDPRLSFVTLVVRDLAASRRFYVDGLGWPVEVEVPEEVVMVRVGEKVVLSLWQEDKAVAEVGPVARPDTAGGVLPFTLAHNVGSPAEVDGVVEVAVAAGATLVAEPERRSWGGYTAYLADPDGFRWEIAHNPSPMGDSLL